MLIQFKKLGVIVIVIVAAIAAHSGAYAQIVPNVSLDSVITRLFPVYAQAVKSGIYDLPRDTTWKNLKTYQAAGVSFQVPVTWLNLGGLGSVVETAFDGSELYFPAVYNERPVLVGVFLLNQRGNTLEEARDSALIDYRTNPDRVFEPGFADSSYTYYLPTGQKCYVLRTRFVRTSTQLNQTRYDLILYSEKFKKAYSLMLSVQYHDPTYAFEQINALDVLAARFYEKVVIE